MCDEWLSSFDAFIADMGPKPSPLHSLDRIDNDGSYEPGNCRWATKHTQRANRRNNMKVPGVRFDKTRGGWWHARLIVNKKHVLLKAFHTEEEAIAARKEAEERYLKNKGKTEVGDETAH